jgi:uncharacterized protein YndB with AHSA1/START domain
MTDTDTSALRLTVEKHIPASPKRVYDAWLDPEKIVQFMQSGPGMTTLRAETDPRVGGTFHVLMHNGETEVPHAGTYLDLTPHTRIAFTWVSPHSVDDSEVTLDLLPDGAGTLVRLTHVRFKSESARDGHHGGWTAILNGLAAYMA